MRLELELQFERQRLPDKHRQVWIDQRIAAIVAEIAGLEARMRLLLAGSEDS